MLSALKKYKTILYKKNGNVLLLTLLFSTVTMIFVSGLTNIVVVNVKTVQKRYDKETVSHLAEAGINYYRWHLNKNYSDFTDGGAAPDNPPCGTNPNPPCKYTHTLKDKNDADIGSFTLEITPPEPGSTKVTITSTGSFKNSAGALIDSKKAGIERVSEATLAIPSYTTYAIAANEAITVPEALEIFGPVHSNKEIRFNGIAHNIVTSSKSTYLDIATNQTYDAVYTTKTGTNAESETFLAGKKINVPEVNFNNVLVDLGQLQSAAGFSLGASDNGRGYHIALNGSSFILSKINAVEPISGCEALALFPPSDTLDKWAINSIGAAITDVINGEPGPSRSFPPNGILFLKDNVWVEGSVQDKRITIVAANLDTGASESDKKNIIVNNNLTYFSRNGKDTIGLVAQKNILIGLGSADQLTIDAALMAKEGFIGRYAYSPDSPSTCGAESMRQNLSIYGSLATNKSFAFLYKDSIGVLLSGYNDVKITYDARLIYAPPPNFPKVQDNKYIMLSWEQR